MPAPRRRRGTRGQALDRVERDRTVGRERRDERDVHALEQTGQSVTGARRTRVGQLARARRKTSSSMGSVSLPVNVFCCLGWKQPSTVTSAGRDLDAVRRTAGAASAAACRPAASTRATSPRRRTRRARRSPGRRASSVELADEVRQAPVALLGRRLVGGRRAAHRGRDVGVVQLEPVVGARPRSAGWRSRCGAATPNSQSPERSPVKTRPVRFPPCAAGARPSDEHAGAADRRSPAPAGPSTPRRGTRPASRARPARATRRAAGHARHSTISAVERARARRTGATGARRGVSARHG